MAVEHMVWIKFNEGVEQDLIDEILANLRALEGTVPAIRRLVVAENFTDRANGYTHGLIVTVADRDALPEYIEHPAHVEAATPLKANAQVMAMDIEV
ncbi:MAG: Dabb family protein [Planctomycetota bacterium]